MIIYTSPLLNLSSSYVRVGVLRDVTRFPKSDWFAVRCTRPSLPVRRRGSAKLCKLYIGPIRLLADHDFTVRFIQIASGRWMVPVGMAGRRIYFAYCDVGLHFSAFINPRREAVKGYCSQVVCPSVTQFSLVSHAL